MDLSIPYLSQYAAGVHASFIKKDVRKGLPERIQQLVHLFQDREFVDALEFVCGETCNAYSENQTWLTLAKMQAVKICEGLTEDRDLVWRCADSLAIRSFLGTSPERDTPNERALVEMQKTLGAVRLDTLKRILRETLSDRGIIGGPANAPKKWFKRNLLRPTCPRWFELFLFIATLCLKIVALVHVWDTEAGFDSGFVMERVYWVKPGEPEPPLKAIYHAYHPPAAFLTFRFLHTHKVPLKGAIQATNTLAAVLVLVFMRAALARMGVLRRWGGIAFLYGLTSLPLVLWASTTQNIDIHVFAQGTILFYCCAALWMSGPTISRASQVGHSLGIIVVLAWALMTKFSGLLLFPMPVLAALFCAQSGIPLLKRLARAVVLATLAGLMVLPYYWERYYVETGEFFPSANEWAMEKPLSEAREWRDAHRTQFVKNFFTFAPQAFELEGPQFRDKGAIRLSDIWKDLWFKNNHIGMSSNPTLWFGILYWAIAPLAIAYGTIIWLRLWRMKDPMAQAGAIFFCLAIIQLAAWMYYAWDQPIGWLTVAKGMYVMPITWAIMLFQALSLESEVAGFRSVRRVAVWARGVLPFALVVYVFVNHLLPVY